MIRQDNQEIDLDTGYYAFDLDTGYYAFDLDTGYYTFDLDTGYHTFDLDTGYYAFDLDTGYYAFDLDTGYHTFDLGVVNPYDFESNREIQGDIVGMEFDHNLTSDFGMTFVYFHADGLDLDIAHSPDIAHDHDNSFVHFLGGDCASDFGKAFVHFLVDNLDLDIAHYCPDSNLGKAFVHFLNADLGRENNCEH